MATFELNEDLRSIGRCGICLEKFNTITRAPFSLLCGHTFCRVCVKRLSRYIPYACGVCRTYTCVEFGDMKKNVTIIDCLEAMGLLQDDADDNGTLSPSEPSSPVLATIQFTFSTGWITAQPAYNDNTYSDHVVSEISDNEETPPSPDASFAQSERVTRAIMPPDTHQAQLLVNPYHDYDDMVREPQTPPIGNIISDHWEYTAPQRKSKKRCYIM